MNWTKESEPVSLSPQALEAVEEIQRLTKADSIQEALRLAIGDELYLRRMASEGWSVVLSKGGEYYEVELTKPG